MVDENLIPRAFSGLSMVQKATKQRMDNLENVAPAKCLVGSVDEF